MESVFQQLLTAIRNFQTGTVTLRRIMQPLFDESTATEERIKFYTEANAADRDDQIAVLRGIENAGLNLPEVPDSDGDGIPDYLETPESDPVPIVDTPPPPPPAPPAPEFEQNQIPASE